MEIQQTLILAGTADLPVGLAGGKAATLSALQRARMQVPEWFVLTPAAMLQAAGQAVRPQLQQLLEENTDESLSQAARLIDTLPFDEELVGQIDAALDRLGFGQLLLAVRSSAIDEDGARHSFAGQLESYLFVPRDKVTEKIRQVWKSGFSQRVLRYRREAEIDTMLQPPAVLVQRMVDAEVSGVAFGVDPVSGDPDLCVIAAVYGLGTGLVSGELDADTYHVDRRGQVIKRELAAKTHAYRMDRSRNEGLSKQAVDPELINRPALDYTQIEAIASLVRQAGEFLGTPQDIEWAIAKNRLYLLQARPVTALSADTHCGTAHNLWDNSNIAESYGGITTPLTFSFARRAYEEVYREFCRVLRVPAQVIRENDLTFKRMLGLIRGRVYYNLLSWYRVLAMLPGFTMNRRFMEQMMGVKEPLPDEILNQLGQASTWARAKDSLRFANTLLGLLSNHFLLPYKIKRFYKRLNQALDQPQDTLKRLSADQLIACYHRLEQQLLTRWDAPLINDFFAMIFYGVLGKRCKHWLGDEAGTLQNDLLCGEGGMISAEPAKHVRRMARLLAAQPGLADVFASGSLREIHRRMAALPELEQEYKAYLEKFGDRCLDELKLESETLHDNPLLLLRSVGTLAKRFEAGDEPADGELETSIRTAAEKRVRERLGGQRLRYWRFNWTLKHARRRVRDRENLRFERTRLFGRVRRIFIEIGKRLQAIGVLDKARDVFYLETGEIAGYIEGTGTTTRLRDLVALRRAEFEAYADTEAPADRFETTGIVAYGNDYRSRVRMPLAGADQERIKGMGCSPGIVEGTARVITNPRHASLKSGEILVAERTDPGWIMLFPAAAGIVVERGSMLSHSAIVAREMGIPAIVAAPGVMRWLRNGDRIQIDGSTGWVSKLKNQAEHHV